MQSQKNERRYPNHERARKSSNKLLLRGNIILGILIVVIFSLPYLITHKSWVYLGVDDANEIGDALGGIMGPMIGILGAALTFYAFWAQYDANLKQQVQMGIQDRRASLDAFENKFYTMLSIHRDNVNGIDLNGTIGRKVFMFLFDELRFLYWVVRDCYEKSPNQISPESKLNEEDIYQVAYLSFFFGIGEKSTPLVMDLAGKRLEAFVENVHSYIGGKFNSDDKRGTRYALDTLSGTITWRKTHTLGVGHMRRLSHYVRHLYQIVKFVDDQPEELLDEEQKYNFITNLRAQLSALEQILLYYNALSVLGEPWLTTIDGAKESYIVKYCLVKSMPINSADFYKVPGLVLPEYNNKGKSMFEWLDIRRRMLAKL